MVLTIAAGPGGSTFRMVLHSYMVSPCSTHGVLSFEVLHMAWVSHIMVVSGYLMILLTEAGVRATRPVKDHA